MKYMLLVLLVVTSCTITSNVVKEPYSKIEIYFCPQDQCMEKIIQLIETSIDTKCAFYDLDLPELISKLKNAEVVIEDSNALDEFMSGYSSALMHNKFCIFDSEIILTGSMNPTERGNYYNNNNIVIIKSKYLAENFLDEFDELKNNIYGKGNKVKNPIIIMGNTKVENYFCPEDNCKLHVINTLKNANKSIYFMTYSFTDVDIGNLLYNKDYLGLDVKGILEKKQISDYSRYDDLKEFSIIDKNTYTMHHKVFIIDGKIVITGSYNPTKNANERNDENILIIHDEETAQKYIDEFNRLFNYQESIPDKTSNLIIYKIMYDAPGSDTDKEYVELKNIGEENIILDYYFLNNNKSTSRLHGILKPNETITVKPKFSLKNSNDILFLKKNHDIIDYVAWEGFWDLEAKEGELLTREDPSLVGEDAW